VADGNSDRVHLALEIEVDGLNRSGHPICKSLFKVDIKDNVHFLAHF
jgi:hypothetical protein